MLEIIDSLFQRSLLWLEVSYHNKIGTQSINQIEERKRGWDVLVMQRRKSDDFGSLIRFIGRVTPKNNDPKADVGARDLRKSPRGFPTTYLYS